MARLVEQVVPQFKNRFKDRIRVVKVVTKTMEGARRYQALAKAHGKLLPIPSIVINGTLVFDTTPGEQVLALHLSAMLEHPPGSLIKG